MNKCKVLNQRTDKIPSTAVYVGRPSKWGNPFKIGMHYQEKILNRNDTIEAHKDWLLHSSQGMPLLGDLHEIRGCDLVCWCAPLPCHADLLLKLANGENTADG